MNIIQHSGGFCSLNSFALFKAVLGQTQYLIYILCQQGVATETIWFFADLPGEGTIHVVTEQKLFLRY